ncbi:MAG: hypothetical protein HC913_06170 [Microscillaceae bacterium]|nr:hypothetical protein [Microscillaceae bacterium]
MRKNLLLFVLFAFLASCSGARPLANTWVPPKHKPMDMTRPLKRKR